jgi:tetratricopeptide (TPR) repeat protein
VRLRLAALVLCVLAVPARADEPGTGAPAPAPDAAPAPAKTPDAVAAAVQAALAKKDDETLKGLAQSDDPDPWLVVDSLLGRGDPGAATSFAAAGARKDTERLAAYVAARKGKSDDVVHRGTAASAEAAVAGKRWSDAVDATAGTPPPDTVVAVRLSTVRGYALRGARRLPESADAFSRAGETAARIGWVARGSSAYSEAGTSLLESGDPAGALAAGEKAYAIDKDREDKAALSRSLANLGTVYRALGNNMKALEFNERALKTSEEAGDLVGAVRALGGLGQVHSALGNFSKAVACQERELQIKQDLGERTSSTAAGPPRKDSLGQFAGALKCHEHALKMKEQVGDKAGVAQTLVSLGLVQESLSNYTKALDYYERALKIQESLKDARESARTLGSIGNVKTAMGKWSEAFEYYERATKGLETLGDKPALASAYDNVGVVHFSSGNAARALDYHDRALKLLQELDDKAGQARVLDHLGNVHLSLGAYEKALELKRRALQAQEELGDRVGWAKTLGNIGLVQAAQGQYEAAFESLNRALKAMEELGDRAGVARSFANIGSLQRLVGDYSKALASIDRAVREAERLRSDPLLVHALTESARTHLLVGEPAVALAEAKTCVGLLEHMLVGLADEEGSHARGGFADVYALGALAATRRGMEGDLAFFLEGGRAGALLESLGGRTRIRGVGIPEELRLAETEARAKETLALAEYTRALAGGDRAEVQAKREALDVRRRAVNDAIERIQREAKREASVFYPRAATLEEIQGWLAEGQALVLYGFTLDETVALVITSASANIIPLGPSSAVTDACEALHLDDPAGDSKAALEALRGLVAAPLNLGDDVKRVFVSPEGALSYVPFALLFGTREVVYVPSGTTYGALLEEQARKGEKVLALGDPDYSVRVDARDRAARDTYANGPRGRGLIPLPQTRIEAKAVGDVTLLGEQATEAGLRLALSKGAGWHAIHFACHGIIDPERPSRSSLALTATGDSHGFLTAPDILNESIPSDLVVLSACETGRGEVVRGEGIVGLTRAFMLAGAPRVIVSLWKVDDEATRELMLKFYELWKSGAPTARALREAQEYIRAKEAWKHPYYWAAWVLWGLGD